MDDRKIIELYNQRNEKAISETSLKYGKYCFSIANNILGDRQDSEECVNDTWLKTWNAIPPQEPRSLKLFLGKITRNLALDRYDSRTAKKRECPLELALEEISECVPDVSAERESDGGVLRDAINSFLASLPRRTRIIFMQRYWYLSSISEISSSASNMVFKEMPTTRSSSTTKTFIEILQGTVLCMLR